MIPVNSHYIRRVYSLYSPFYDIVFGKIMEQGRKKAIGLLKENEGAKILEIGVGTGLTLGLYPRGCTVFGIDISKRMLAKAESRVAKTGNGSHFVFKVMDVLNLDFNDDTFDAVVASYVITTVNDPLRACMEMRRVCKENGKIIAVNHSKSENGVLAKLEEMISPLCWRIGFAMDLNVVEPLSKSGIEIENVFSVKPFNLYKVIQGTKMAHDAFGQKGDH